MSSRRYRPDQELEIYNFRMVPELQISKKVDFLMIYMICVFFCFRFLHSRFHFVLSHGSGHSSFFPFSGSMAFLSEKHGSARFSGRKTWMCAFFYLKNMDLHVFRVGKHGSARFSVRKTWIRAFFGSKNMDLRVFLIEKHGFARFSD